MVFVNVIKSESATGRDRLLVVRSRTFPEPGARGWDSLSRTPFKLIFHPGATGSDYGQSRTAGWVYGLADIGNGTDRNLIVTVTATWLGLLRDSLAGSDRINVTAIYILRDAATGSDRTGGQSAGGALSGLSVWTGSAEVPVKGLTVWNGTAEVPVVGYSVMP